MKKNLTEPVCILDNSSSMRVLENTSKEYPLDTANAKIEHCREKVWEFLLVGANMDALKVSGTIALHCQ